MTDPLAPADPARSVAVFASAGTGKTWLLVARLLRLLLGGAEPDSILAITFTRKAATEIQQRLVERLEKWLSLDDGALAEELARIGVASPEENLARARALFETAQFSDPGVRVATFHSFFQELLRRFPLEAGAPAGFSIPQREQSARLHQAAEDLLFEEARRDPDGELAASMNAIIAEYPSLSELRRALEEFREHILEWRAFAGERGLAQLRAHLRDDVFGPDEEPPVRIADLETDIRRLASLLEKSGKTNRSHQAKAAAKLVAALEREGPESLERVRQLSDALHDPGEGELRSSLWPTAEKVQQRLGQDIDELMELLSIIPPQIHAALDRLLRRKSREINGHWYALVGRLADHYQRLKRDQGYLDFDDLLWFSNRLMDGGVEWVRYKLGQSFRHVLVDEFQDTDSLSWQTLRVFLDALEETGDGSAFIVGDTKQSIYQWRRANPEIQKEASAYLQSRLRAGGPISMDSSRRSAPVLIDFVNATFQAGGVFPLPGFTTHDALQKDLWGRVELLPPVEKKPRARPVPPDPSEPLRDPLTQPRPGAQSTHLERTADRIAERIQRIVEERTRIEDPGAGPRAAQFRDCMILVDRRTHVPQIEHALARREIPFARQSRQTLLQHLEVRDMQALLQFLVRPADDLSLAQVLRSPLYGVTDEELMELAETRTDSGLWRDRLEALAARKDPEHPLRRAAESFQEWRALVGRIPTHDLLDRVYFETDALRRYQGAWPGERGERAVSNLTRFIELTLEFDSGRYPSTAAFVHFIEEMRRGHIEGYDAPDLVSLKSSDQDDRVQILTVHAAKGLEAPIVVYVDLDKPREQGRLGELLIDWPADQDRPRRFLFRPRKEDMDSHSRECLEEARRKRKEEEINRAYVAFTRARQMLILCQHEELHQELRETTLGLFIGDDDTDGLALGPAPRAADPVTPPATPEPNHAGLDEPLKLPDAGTMPPSATRTSERPEDQESGNARPGALKRGVLIHALIETLETGEPGPDRIENLARGLGRPPEDPEIQGCLDEARRLVGDPTLDSIFRPDGRTRVYTEVPVLCDTEAGEGYGVIDRLLISPDQAWIIDFKSHATEDPKRLNEIAERYATQMSEYARFIRLVYPDRSTRCSLLFTRARQLREMSA